MKKYKTAMGFAIAVITLLAAQAIAEEQLVLKTRIDRESYTTGVTVVRNLKYQGGEINLDMVVKGMMDELTGYRLLMTEEDLQKTMVALQTEMMQRQRQALRKEDEKKTIADNNRAMTAEAGRDDVSNNKQDQERQEQTNNPIGQGGLLAARGSAGMSAPAVNNGSGTGQRQAGPEQQNEQGGPLTPNGPVLSKRNLAKLSVAEMKREMRASVASGGTAQ